MVARDAALDALRRVLGERARELDFVTVLSISEGGPVGFLVRLRVGQRLHPHTLLVAADDRSLALDHGLGEPLPAPDAELWADGVVDWLTEQLATGVLRWGRRITLDDGTRVIDPSLDAGPPSPWFVASVPLRRPTAVGQRRLRRLARRGGRSSVVTLGDRIEMEPDPAPGDQLVDGGFDVRPARTAQAEGRLVRWLQLFEDDRTSSSPIGQLVLSWRDEQEAIAQLEYIEHRPAAPADAVEELILDGLQTAADVGARWVEHRLEDADNLLAGLPWGVVGGIARLDAAEIP